MGLADLRATLSAAAFAQPQHYYALVHSWGSMGCLFPAVREPLDVASCTTPSLGVTCSASKRLAWLLSRLIVRLNDPFLGLGGRRLKPNHCALRSPCPAARKLKRLTPAFVFRLMTLHDAFSSNSRFLLGASGDNTDARSARWLARVGRDHCAKQSLGREDEM